MRSVEAARPELALNPLADIFHEYADRPNRVGEVDVREPREPLAERLQTRQRDEGPQYVIRTLEDRKDANVPKHLLVRLVAHVARAAFELKRAVGLVPEELGRCHLADRGLERIVGNPPVYEPGRQVGHRLESEQVRHHPADLVLDELEVRQRTSE